MLKKNVWVTQTLQEFLESISSNYYNFVIGSVALLSWTKDYERTIGDIDIIGTRKDIEHLTKCLKKKGYSQSTFIDSKFPLARLLNEQSGKKYFRFEKDGKPLEILATRIVQQKGKIEVELYPHISISLPEESVRMTEYLGVPFRAVSPEGLFCIHNVGLKTWGRFVKKKRKQRRADLESLQEILDMKTLYFLANNTFIRIGKIKVKIPSRFIVS